ncbi:MAG: transposase [Myxococcales bacterium]|nr:transposase [Myxococcales bacterium]
MRFAFILAERACWPVVVMCAVLKVSSSGFYAWLRSAPSERAKKDERLKVLIGESFAKSRQTYGSPRVHADLADEHVGRNRVIRLMQDGQLVAASTSERAPSLILERTAVTDDHGAHLSRRIKLDSNTHRGPCGRAWDRADELIAALRHDLQLSVAGSVGEALWFAVDDIELTLEIKPAYPRLADALAAGVVEARAPSRLALT